MSIRTSSQPSVRPGPTSALLREQHEHLSLEDPKLDTHNSRLITHDSRLVAFAYTAAIVLTEVVVLLWGVGLGTLCDAALVAVLLGHFTLRTAMIRPGLSQAALRDPLLRLLPVLALLPLLRILSVTMPVQRVAEIYWYALTGIPLLTAVVLTMRLLDLSLADVGLSPRVSTAQGLIGWSGVPLGVVAYAIVRPAPLLSGGAFRTMYAGIVILLVFTGLTEELLFRGLLQPLAIRALGSVKGGIGTAGLLFAAMNLGSRSALYVAFTLAAGLYFGWCVRKTGSLWGVVIAHGVMNIAALLVLPLLWS